MQGVGAGVRSRGLMQGQRLRCQGVGEGDAGGWRKQGQIRISCMPMCRTLLQNTCHVRAAVALTGLYVSNACTHQGEESREKRGVSNSASACSHARLSYSIATEAGGIQDHDQDCMHTGYIFYIPYKHCI